LSSRHLFIAGATGAVGQTLVPLARAAGVEVTAHARPRSAGKLGPGASALLELDDPRLPEVMKGCTTVVQLIGTVRARFRAGDTYESSDIGTTRRLVEVARQVGVDHLVLLSSVGAGRPVGAYLKAKAKAEALVRAGGIPWTIVRPSAFEDRGGQRLPGARAVMRFLGLPKWELISLGELASAIVKVAVDRGPLHEVLEGRSLWDVVARAGELS
jgi:uncharacterized protein YbjT (DUF2867 family)